MAKDIFDRLDKRRSWNEEETRNDRGSNEFEQIDAQASRRTKESAADRFQIWRGLRQQSAQVSRCQIPDFVCFIADQRPRSYSLRWRRERDRSIAKL